MISLGPPWSEVTQGSPEARASTTLLPKVSVRLGKTKRSAEAKTPYRSSPCSTPVKRTRSHASEPAFHPVAQGAVADHGEGEAGDVARPGGRRPPPAARGSSPWRRGPRTGAGRRRRAGPGASRCRRRPCPDGSCSRSTPRGSRWMRPRGTPMSRHLVAVGVGRARPRGPATRVKNRVHWLMNQDPAAFLTSSLE